MNFANPSALWLLLILPPAVVGLFWWAGRKRRALINNFIQDRLLAGLLVGFSPARRRLRQTAFLLGIICLILTLARPQWGFQWEEAKVRALDIVVAIDTSKSMLAEDIAPNRLARAKLAALDLMQKAASDRLGLVAFAGTAFLTCPLTIDDQAFRQSVNALDVTTLPVGGTAIAEAIQTALTAFKNEDNYKVLVLFSDGEDQDSGAVEAAKKAAQAGLRIYTIGVGTPEGELLRIKQGGRSEPIRDENGTQVKSRLKEDLLQEIAGVTEGGFYLPLRGASVIDTLYDRGLSKLPKTERQERFVKRYHERYQWPLGLALLLFIVEVFISERARERVTTPKPMTAAKAGAGAALFVSMLLAADSAVASSSSALREYKAGKYDQALKDYEQALKRQDDPRLRYNAGTAAYRNRQLEQALREFEEALKSPDLKLQERAYYNRGNTRYYLGESAGDINKRRELWQKSVQDFESVLKLNPAEGDAKFNRDFVKKQLEELEKEKEKNPNPENIQPSEAAKKAKALADEAVSRRLYKQALEIMEKQLAQDPTTRFYEGFMQHLREVINVQDSAQSN